MAAPPSVHAAAHGTAEPLLGEQPLAARKYGSQGMSVQAAGPPPTPAR